MNKIIIDTSAWIDFFRNQSGVVGDVVSSLISQDQAVIAGPIVSELLQGLKNRREGKTLGELFSINPGSEQVNHLKTLKYYIKKHPFFTPIASFTGPNLANKFLIPASRKQINAPGLTI